MSYYVIQVKTKNEESFLDTAKQSDSLKDLNFIWIRKSTKIRKSGAWKETIASVFPGYVFIDIEDLPTSIFKAIRANPGFIKFLRSNDNVQPLSEGDRKILIHFLSFGQVIGKSKVYFDEDMRIRVLSGPLKGLEGHIIKVDRRKQRARIIIDLYENAYPINMDFEVISQVNSAEENHK